MPLSSDTSSFQSDFPTYQSNDGRQKRRSTVYWKYEDPDTGSSYFVNDKTGVSQWEAPPDSKEIVQDANHAPDDACLDVGQV